MEEKICAFFGHRQIDATDELCKSLALEILKAIELGCRIFYFGGYGEFDTLCYETVTKIKDEHPELNLKRVYCVPEERYLRKKSRYFNPQDYDEVIYLQKSFDGWYKSIYFRNCAMIDNSDYLIFYAEQRQTSGAYKAYKYARLKKKKGIINLYSKLKEKEQS